jgi:hypothetical protein
LVTEKTELSFVPWQVCGVIEVLIFNGHKRAYFDVFAPFGNLTEAGAAIFL